MSNFKQTPGWVGAIRSGNFDQAEAELSQNAGQRAYERMETERVEREVQRISAQNPYARYVHNDAIQTVAHEFQQGRITNPDQLISRYASALDEHTEAFRREVRPGHMRSATEPYTPADQEVREYINSRRAHSDALRAEGRAIASVTPNSGRK